MSDTTLRQLELAIERILAALLITLAGVRCLVRLTPEFTGAEEFDAALGARQTAILDWLGVAMLAAVIGLRLFQGRKVHCGLLALWLIGSVAALAHGAIDLPSLRMGGSWSAALAMGLAAMHLGENAEARRWMIAGLVALIVPLSIGAIYQVAVTQPETVRYYELQKKEGKPPPAAMADPRAFERRLYQAEATGEFGFSNVFGSVTMTIALLSLGLLLTPSDWPISRWTVAAPLLLAAICTFITFSKGANAALIGMAIVTLSLRLMKLTDSPKLRRLAGLILLGVAAVAIRGAIFGESAGPEGERSLLFRWHYWQAAMKMTAEHPGWGVGPGRFQEFYFILKNPFSPEDVTDPHNVFLAWISTLGIGGWAWSAALVWLLLGAAGQCGKPVEIDTAQTTDRRAMAITISAVIGLVQLSVKLPTYWIDSLLLWAAGIAGMCWVMRRLSQLRLDDRAALFAAAVALLMHAQIEMTLTGAMAGPPLMMVSGLAAARRSGSPVMINRMTPRLIAAPIGVAIVSLMLVYHTAPILRAQADPVPAALGAAMRLAQQEQYDQGQNVLIAARTRGVDLGALWRGEANLCFIAGQRTGDRAWLMRAVEAAEKAMHYQPHDLTLAVMAADLARQAGLIDKARQAYRHALELDRRMFLDPIRQLSDSDRRRVEDAAR